MMRQILKEESDLIIDLFVNQKKKVSEIINIVKRPQSTIDRLLRANGIPRRKEDKNKYFINKAFLSNLYSEDFLYFLGLLMADGYFHEKTNTISIDLMRGDKGILEQLAKIIFVDNNYKIKTYKTSIQGYAKRESEKYRLQINSKDLSDILRAIGVSQKKSFTLEWPKMEIRPDLLHHFIRGMIDGDGCLSKFKKSDSFCVHLISSVVFCESMKTEMAKIGFDFKIKYEDYCSKPMATLWLFGNNRCKKFLDWMYKDANLFLERKKCKYLDLITDLNTKRLKFNKKGYTLHKHSGLYLVNISRTINGERKLLYWGYFKTPEEARAAYLVQSEIIYNEIDSKKFG